MAEESKPFVNPIKVKASNATEEELVALEKLYDECHDSYKYAKERKKFIDHIRSYFVNNDVDEGFKRDLGDYFCDHWCDSEETAYEYNERWLKLVGSLRIIPRAVSRHAFYTTRDGRQDRTFDKDNGLWLKLDKEKEKRPMVEN